MTWNVKADRDVWPDIYKSSDNAIKFSKTGGRIEIVLSAQNDDFIKASVIDYGMGIPRRTRKMYLRNSIRRIMIQM